MQNAIATPIFWGTGNADPLVKLQFTKESIEHLVNVVGVPAAKPGVFGGLSYNLYEGMGHTTVPEELEAVKKFITTAIPAQ